MPQIDMQRLEDELFNARKRGTPGVVDLEALAPLSAAPSPAGTRSQPPASIDLQNLEDAFVAARKRGQPGVVDLDAVSQMPKAAPAPAPTTPAGFRLFGAASTEGVDADFAGRVERARKDLEGKGYKLQLSDDTFGGKRTIEQQQQMYAKHGPGKAAKPSPNAPHVRGHALDLAAFDAKGVNAIRDPAVRAILQGHGLRSHIPHEPWHWEPDAAWKPQTVAQPAPQRATVTKAGPVAPPKARSLHPAESAWERVETLWQGQAPAVRGPKYTPAEGGAVERLWQRRANAALSLRQAMPQIRQRFKETQKAAFLPTATPEDRAAYEQAFQRLQKYERSIEETLTKPPKHAAGKPLFNSLFYGNEGKNQPLSSGMEDWLEQQWERAKAFAPGLASKAEEIFGWSNRTEAAKERDVARAGLQRRGLIAPLPKPSRDPQQRAVQVGEKNQLLDAAKQALVQIEVGRSSTVIPLKMDLAGMLKRNPQQVRQLVEATLGKPMSPWQKQIYPALVRNLVAETLINRPVTYATGIDAGIEIVSDVLAGFGAGLGAKAATKGLGRSLTRPEKLLSREGAQYLASKGLVQMSGGMAGGAAAGGPVGAATSGVYAARSGKSPREIAEAARQGFVEGMQAGAVVGGAFTGIHMAARAAKAAAPHVGTLKQKVKATVGGARPKPKAAEPIGKPGHAGPQALAPDGSVVNLREASPDMVRAIADGHEAAGDTASAERARSWALKQEAWGDARAWQIPRENIPDYLAAWNRASDPVRKNADLLAKAATDEKIAPDVRRVLAEAAEETNYTFRDGFRAGIGDPFPNVPPPMVSPWRRLSPEQRQGLSPEVQKALLGQDAVNSQRVIDQEQPWPVTLKGKSPAQWERQADALYQKAQGVLAREFGELPEVATPGAVTPALEPPDAVMGRRVGEPEPIALGRAPEAIPSEQPAISSDLPTIPSEQPAPNVQPEFAEQGVLPSQYQAAALRARAQAQPVGALDTSPQLRTQAEIATGRAGLPPVTPTAPISPGQAATPPAAGPLQSAADIAAARAGVQPARSSLVSPDRPIEMGQAPEVVTPTYAGPERRADAKARKRVAEMSPEERAALLLTDEKTGLGNERAYLESPKAAHQVAIDADSLKWWNDTFGHPAGDQLLGTIGQALKAAGVDGYHISGDEFVVQGNDPAALKKAMAFADDYLASATITVTKGQKTKTLKGLSISYAIKPTNEQVGSPGEAGYRPAYNDADRALKRAKSTRERKGLRAPRGERPPGFAEVGKGERAPRRSKGDDKPAVAGRGGAAEGEARTVAPAGKPAQTKKSAVELKAHPTPDMKPTAGRLANGVRLRHNRTGSVWEVAGPVEERYGYKRVPMRLVSVLPEAERRTESGYRLYAPEYSNVGDVKAETTVNEIAREMKFAPPGEPPTKALIQGVAWNTRRIEQTDIKRGQRFVIPSNKGVGELVRPAPRSKGERWEYRVIDPGTSPGKADEVASVSTELLLNVAHVPTSPSVLPAEKAAAPRPDASVPASTRAAVKADSETAKARLKERQPNRESATREQRIATLKAQEEQAAEALRKANLGFLWDLNRADRRAQLGYLSNAKRALWERYQKALDERIRLEASPEPEPAPAAKPKPPARVKALPRNPQGAVPKGAPEAWQMPVEKMMPHEEWRKRESAPYFDETGQKIASSRTTPRPPDDTPLGTWKVDDMVLNYGREIEQLREFDPNDLVRKEEPGVNVEMSRKDDAERYAEWAKEGKPLPPIRVLQSEDGSFIVSDGHRRHAAARALGIPIRAWVSPYVDIPGKFSYEGTPLKAGLTHELAVWHALKRGEAVPGEVLRAYPGLFEKYGDPKATDAIPVRAEGDDGSRRIMSDTPGAVQGAPVKRRRKECM